MDSEAGSPPPSESNQNIELNPDQLTSPTTPHPTLEEPTGRPPNDNFLEITEVREKIVKLGEDERSQRAPNPPKKTNSITGNNPYPQMPPLRAEEKDNTPIVKGQNFKPDDFSSKGYLHGRKIGSNYGLLKNGYDAYDNERYWNPIIKAIKKYIKPEDSTRILDVGCAAGHFVKRLIQAGYKNTIGIDISPTSLAEAVEKAPETEGHFGEFDLNTDQFSEALKETIDVVTAMDVVEHTAHRIGPDGKEVSGPEHVIPKIATLLKEDGIFIISVPVRDRNPISWLFNLIDTDQSHVSKLPSKEYLRILKANNLEVLEKHYAFLTPWGRIPFLPTTLEVVCKKTSPNLIPSTEPSPK